MTGSCGWYGVSLRGSSANSMASYLPSLGQNWKFDKDAKFSVRAKMIDSGNAAVHANGVVAIVDGTPYARDRRLQKLSNERGLAWAIAENYRKFKHEIADCLGGAFALVVIDDANDEVLLCVDRLGQRRLAYSQVGEDGLAWSSDIRSISNIKSLDCSVNWQSIYDYTFFHVIPSPQSIYENVSKLEPSQFVLYQHGNLVKGYYWAPRFNSANGGRQSDRQLELLDCLETAVSRYKSKLPQAAFLSGGIDSSTVCGFLSKVSDRPTAYSIGFDEAGYDETPYAKLAASHFGLEHKIKYILIGDVLEALGKMPSWFDEPFGNSSAIPSYVCAHEAAQGGARWILAGDGGDELFAGNERYAEQRIFEFYRSVPAWIRNFLFEPSLFALATKSDLRLLHRAANYVTQANTPLPDRLQGYNFLVRNVLTGIFSPDFLRKVNQDSPFEAMRARYDRCDADSSLDRMLWLDWKFTLADNDLRKVTTTAEAAGINVVYPMLDDSLIDLSCQILPQWKMKGSHLRSFFKSSVTDFLPSEIINKEKHGFGLPFGQWLKVSTDLQDFIYPTIGQLADRNIFRRDFLEKLVTSHQTGHAAFYGTMIWVLVQLELWFQSQNNG